MTLGWNFVKFKFIFMNGLEMGECHGLIIAEIECRLLGDKAWDFTLTSSTEVNILQRKILAHQLVKIHYTLLQNFKISHHKIKCILFRNQFLVNICPINICV